MTDSRTRTSGPRLEEAAEAVTAPPHEPVDHVPPTVHRTHPHRRPSGAPPPLPRAIGLSGKGWLVALAVLVAWTLVNLWSAWARRLTDQVDTAILRWFAELRTPWLSSVMRGINGFGIGWLVTVAGLGLIVAIIVFRRWRHLFTFLGSVILVEIIGVTLGFRFSRPRPFDVVTIDRWKSFSLPSGPVAVTILIGVGVVYTMVVPGRPRKIAKAVVTAAIAVYIFARLYLALDHPVDVLISVALAVAIPLIAFRFFTPSEVFPVQYRKAKAAHLDVTGRRGEAIRRAMEDQLGVTVVDIKPVGLAGSGGSTPLRLRVAGDPDTYLFGKLYAMSHVRADRWYKTGRTILYGRLEDEAPFQSVRRLVEYEDYTARLVRDAGIATAEPVGIVEMTPEREYMLVTEFFDGAQEIGDAEVDDHVIDQGLSLIRQLWDAGLAHRDIKPANLMVRDGQVLLIDVAFTQVRPSPWRQAVDLANMMLVLAVRTDAERVYGRALRYFSPDDIAEAFAAARGIASPTQLRSVMKRDGRNLVAEFRALAPERRPISLQRWGVRRIAYAAGLLLLGAFAVFMTYQMFVPAELEVGGEPECGTSNLMVLMAQSVPSATAVPCVETMPAGWSLGAITVKLGRSEFWLSSDQAGYHAVRVQLLRPEACSVAGVPEVPSDEPGTRRFDRIDRLPPGLRTARTYLFPGGCVTYQYTFGADASTGLMFAADSAISFQPRAELVDAVDARTGGLALCGVEAPPCAGSP